MKGHEFLFDRAKRRVTIVKANCTLDADFDSIAQNVSGRDPANTDKVINDKV
jgi:hypothetical protein